MAYESFEVEGMMTHGIELTDAEVIFYGAPVLEVEFSDMKVDDDTNIVPGTSRGKVDEILIQKRGDKTAIQFIIHQKVVDGKVVEAVMPGEAFFSDQGLRDLHQLLTDYLKEVEG